MKIHEYQAKQIFHQYGIPIPEGHIAGSPEEAETIAHQIGKPVVVKAQVHVGGRGKAGGVRLAGTPEEAREAANQILKMNIKRLPVLKVLVEEAVSIEREFYLGITVDRARRRNGVILSAVGGVDIEEVAAKTPEKIAKTSIDPGLGLPDYQIRQICRDGGLPSTAVSGTIPILKKLYQLYLDLDASLAEINPLVLTASGTLLAADAKMNFDDNALFRHPELAQYKEENEEDPLEAEAHRRGLQYVHLEGDIGIIGNGAGLVMATLDEVKRAGGLPANFLDIGGGARAELVKNSLEMVLLNPVVRGVFINVFGGITRCDEVARGIIEAKSSLKIHVPLVVRLTGTNEREGRALLAQAGIIPVDTMQGGAAKIVEMETSTHIQKD